MFDEGYLKWLDRHGVARPSQDKHGVDSWENPIGDKLEKLDTFNWRMEGPGKLVCDTPAGKLVNMVSPDLIMTGLDDNNLPILQEIKL